MYLRIDDSAKKRVIKSALTPDSFNDQGDAHKKLENSKNSIELYLYSYSKLFPAKYCFLDRYADIGIKHFKDFGNFSLPPTSTL